jgi:N-acetyl-1-D-myo-inositol-2-amino-2-deoxy-alpha-D-glucopyranoside deacetylase
MAAYAASGAQVTLVTCTLGELGEVIPPELAGLAAGPDDRADPGKPGDRGKPGERLGRHRMGELAAACAALGVRDHRFLGGAGRWRDSGMMGLPSNDAPGCFWRADVTQAAAELAAIIAEVRPQAVVTYDDRGYYGHPDHIQAHRVTVRAVELAAAGAPGHGRWRVPKLYATAMPRSVLAEAIKLGPRPPAGFTAAGSVTDLPFGVPDEQVTTQIDGTAYLAAKAAAMRAHATQITVDGEFFALSDRVGQRILGREYYTLLTGPSGGARPAGGGAGREPWHERDLFAGL